MIEHHRLKRGLVRLGQGTAEALEWFSDMPRQEVMSWLDDNPGIVTVTGEGRWVLLPEGRVLLRGELTGLSEMSTPDLDLERDAAVERLGTSVALLLEQVDALGSCEPAEVWASLPRLRLRASATRKAVGKLGVQRPSALGLLPTLDDLDTRLEGIDAVR